LASPRAIVKVVAVGDQLETGDLIQFVNTFAVNDHAQVAFSAYGKGQQPLGIFLASPVPPQISSVAIKTKRGRPRLIVDGTGLITNDSTIEINGTTLGDIAYPEAFKQAGGTTTRLVSTDSRLGQILIAGQQAQVSVNNPLTATQSAPFS